MKHASGDLSCPILSLEAIEAISQIYDPEDLALRWGVGVYVLFEPRQVTLVCKSEGVIIRDAELIQRSSPETQGVRGTNPAMLSWQIYRPRQYRCQQLGTSVEGAGRLQEDGKAHRSECIAPK